MDDRPFPTGLTLTPHFVAGLRLDLLTIDPDQALAALGEDAFENPARNPYYGHVWPAAKALAELVVERGALAGRRVLDLGCGPGVVGVVAARHGARVTFADVMPEAVALAVGNAERNGATGEGVVLDFRAVAADVPSHDFVLASDLLYEPWQTRPLAVALRRLVAPGGEGLVADPYRRPGDAFAECATRAGFTVSAVRRVVGLGKRTAAIRVFRLLAR